MAIRGTKPIPADVAELLAKGLPPRPNPVSTSAVADYAGVAGGAEMLDSPGGLLMPGPRVTADPVAMQYFEFYRESTGFGHLKKVDLPLLEMLCIYLSLFDRVMDEYLTKATLVQIAVSGMETPSPYLQYMLKVGEVIRKLCMELAFTPIERARLKGAKSGSPEEMAREAKRQQMHAKYLSGTQFPPADSSS